MFFFVDSDKFNLLQLSIKESTLLKLFFDIVIFFGPPEILVKITDIIINNIIKYYLFYIK